MILGFLQVLQSLNGEIQLIFFYVRLLEGLSETLRFLSLLLGIFFLYIFYFIFLYHKFYPLPLYLDPKN